MGKQSPLERARQHVKDCYQLEINRDRGFHECVEIDDAAADEFIDEQSNTWLLQVLEDCFE